MGTGVGVLLAPMSGTDLRRALVARLTGLKREVSGSVEQAASSAEKKVEAVTAGAEAVKDAVLQKADAAAGALRHAADDTRPASPGAKNHGTGGPTHSQHS